jgi:PKD repeat protein
MKQAAKASKLPFNQLPGYLPRVMGLLALPLTLAACAGGGAPAPGDPAVGDDAPSVRLSAEPVRGEVPLVVNFTAMVEPAPSEPRYLWDFGFGEPSAGSKSRPYVYTEPGRYTASVEVRSSAGNPRGVVVIEALESSKAPDINNEPPEVTLSAVILDPVAPHTVTFVTTAEDPNGDELSYVIDFGDGKRAVGASATHTYAGPGSYLATVVVRDGRDEAVTAEAEVTLE